VNKLITHRSLLFKLPLFYRSHTQSSTHESNEEYSSEGNTGIDLSGAIQVECRQPAQPARLDVKLNGYVLQWTY
jgi:hypothetical protein